MVAPLYHRNAARPRDAGGGQQWAVGDRRASKGRSLWGQGSVFSAAKPDDKKESWQESGKLRHEC